MTQTEMVFQGIGLVILFTLVILKASFWMCASSKLKEPPVIPDDANTLKIWPGFFFDVFGGNKTFELRRADRDFRLDQVWYLREWIPPVNARYMVTEKAYQIPGRYTGSWVKVKITYLMHHELESPASGIAPGYCVWGFKVLEKWDDKLGLHLNERGLII